MFLNKGLFDLLRSEKRNKNCTCLKRGYFGAAQVEKVEALGGGGGGGVGLSRGTSLYCPYMEVPPPRGVYIQYKPPR